MVGWEWLVVYALAVARVTTFLVADELTRPAREWVGLRLGIDQGRHRQLAYLASCSWCASIYVGAAAAPLVYWFGSSPWLFVPALALASSEAAGLLSGVGRS